MKKHEFNIEGYLYYIMDEREFSEEELCIIEKILQNFPHASKSQASINRFLEFLPNEFPVHILAIAANAYDGYGNTMLGVACEYGYSVEAVQKLIDMGADLNTPDHNMKKLPLHWAINNKMSFRDKDSYEAVEVVSCLLNNGAKTNITCYQNMTPFEYAKSRGFIAAAHLIENCANNRSGNISESERSSALASNSLFSENVTKTQENYCGFKPGFLIGKSF